MLHNVGEKVFDEFLDPGVAMVDTLDEGAEVVFVRLSQQAARLLVSNTNSHVSSVGTAPTKFSVPCT